MTTTDYRPIACDVHSEYELLAMRGALIDARQADGAELRRVRVIDVVIRDRAEYLVVQPEHGDPEHWRLDQIRGLQAVDAG